ncbi:MAG: hypothetical protein II323_06305 [Tidjanibacter sp.]|nr:hypothetical protein [Tidjanibacter sp.]
MKKFFRFATLLTSVVAMVIAGCTPTPPEPPVPTDPFEGASLSIKLVGADINTATVAVNAEVIKIAGYIIAPASEETTAPTPAEIFEKGTLVALEAEADTQVTFRNLEADTRYDVYFAGRITADKVWSEVKSFSFKTAAEPVIPVLTAKLIGTDATSAEIQLYAENISRIAYVATAVEDSSVAPEAPKLQVIFATGKTAELVQGDNTLIVKNLLPKTDYVVFIAAEIAGIEEYMEEVVVVKHIRTTDFADDINVRDINYRGFTVDVRVDPRVKEQNHMIKWATADLFMYNMNSVSDFDYAMMNLHDNAWGGMNLFNESRSLIIDEEHSYLYGPDGQIENWYYESIVPGQPQVVIFGEFARGESQWGWGYGYYKPMFDAQQYMIDQSENPNERLDEAPYWSGFYQHLDVQVQKPEPISEDLINVEIEKFPDDALIKISADKSIDLVSVMVMSELEYNSAMQYIKPEHLQWFSTSLMGAYQGVSMQVDPWGEGMQGSLMTAISQFLLDIPRESKFWVYVVGMRGDFNGDGYLDGNEQVCEAYEFYLPQPTKPAPEIVVTALESTSPFEVSFNVKCPTKDAYRGCSISNYEKEWLMTGMSGAELLEAYGEYFAFSSVELARINSDEGLTVTYPSRPNENNYFAAMVANDEGTETYSETVIARSLSEPAKPAVDSALFESLQGEWTASARVTYSLYNEETEQYDVFNETQSCPVTIGNFEYPEQLTEEDYATFQRHGVSRETADVYYAEFKAAAKTFIDNTRAQNRILMNGFNFSGELEPYYAYADPYSLFTSDTYNGYTSEMPIYDFGPKWYLEVAADGTVTAPFNVNYFTPMSSWYTTSQAIYESHFIAYEPTTGTTAGYMGDAEGNAVNGQFPVEVSEDGNTITVKPFEYSGLNFYPNSAIYFGSGQYQLGVKVVSEITLTRNTAATETPAKAIRKSGKLERERIQSAQEIKTPARPASRAAFGPVKEYKKVESTMNLTKEQRGKEWFETRRNAGRR